ncbi:hypothetical protein M0R45_034512 [Rubus argutus]|uniref:CCHC-type domain-containing protein n=1 Tax=Rubus argutus TaxID=59490 RepID=A0AAW1VVR6_RUBAR
MKKKMKKSEVRKLNAFSYFLATLCEDGNTWDWRHLFCFWNPPINALFLSKFWGYKNTQTEREHKGDISESTVEGKHHSALWRIGNLSGPIPGGWEIKTEVQGAGSETSGYCCPPSGYHSFKYADMLRYENDAMKAKISNYSAPGFPSNPIPTVERPPWIPHIAIPQVPSIRRWHRSTVRRRHVPTVERLHMPIHVLSLQRPFSVRAPCIDGGGLEAKRKQPRCSRCGKTGHNIRTCGEAA